MVDDLFEPLRNSLNLGATPSVLEFRIPRRGRTAYATYTLGSERPERAEAPSDEPVNTQLDMTTTR
jgi:hypothetical protein